MSGRDAEPLVYAEDRALLDDRVVERGNSRNGIANTGTLDVKCFEVAQPVESFRPCLAFLRTDQVGQGRVWQVPRACFERQRRLQRLSRLLALWA